MATYFIPYTFGDVYYNTESLKGVWFPPDNQDPSQAFVTGMNPTMNDIIPPFAQKTEMSNSDFDQLVESALRCTSEYGKTIGVLAQFGKKRTEEDRKRA